VFSALLKSDPPLDEASVLWLADTFAWALDDLDLEVFRDRTRLVLPTNDFFPGRADSPHAMAQLIFERCVDYADMAHWPFYLLEPGNCPVPAPRAPRLEVAGGLRGRHSTVALSGGGEDRMPVDYDPQLVGNPEALIASFAHVLAASLAQAAPMPPPGGPENLPHAGEVTAVFLGFGLMVANSAKTIQVRSCGSCGSGQAGRKSYLSQYDVTYALALFAVLKGISAKALLPHLAKHLRPFFKKAVKDIEARPDLAAPLHARLRRDGPN